MTLKTLEVNINPMTLVNGWYCDPETGQWYYYDEQGMRYVCAAGHLYAMVAWETAPKVVNVKPGDTLRITVSFKYSGLAKTCKLRGAIGNLGTSWPYSFDEVLFARSLSFTLPESPDPVTFNKQVDIPITTAITAGSSYSVYTKLEDGVSFQEGVTGSIALKDAIFVVSSEPTFSDFKIDDYRQV